MLGTLAAFALARSRFRAKESITLLFVLPIALPGIITGIALLAGDPLGRPHARVLDHRRRARDVLPRDRHNNVIARLRRIPTSWVEASMDLGADGWQTFRYVLLPQIATALLAGGMLAFALSFDEIIVTLFTAGHERTLPIWFYNELFRPRERPITNVVAVIVILVTLVPILLAYYLTRPDEHGVRQLTPQRASRHTMQTKLLINGKLVAGAGEVEDVLNPATGKVLARVAEASREQVDAAVAAADAAFDGWARTPPKDRATLLLKLADRIEADGAGFAKVESQNCGKPYPAALDGRDPGHRRRVPLLRRRLPQPHGRGRGRVPRRLHQHDPPRSDRRRGLDRAVELPADDGGVEARAGAGRRQHRGAQAVRADAAHGAEARRAARRALPAGRRQRRRRPRRVASAPRSHAIRRCG